MYYALFEPSEEGGFVITFPDLGWGATQAENEQEARKTAADLLRTILMDEIKQGAGLPAAKKHRGRQYRLITLPALESAKVELYRAFHESGMRKAELARQLGIPKVNVDRLFDLNHTSRLDQMEQAFRVLGKRMTIAVEDAA